jgi:hypothetical protein
VHKGLKKGIAVLAAVVLFCGSSRGYLCGEYGDDFHEKGLSPLCEKLYLGQLVGRENRCADGGY